MKTGGLVVQTCLGSEMIDDNGHGCGRDKPGSEDCGRDKPGPEYVFFRKWKT